MALLFLPMTASGQDARGIVGSAVAAVGGEPLLRDLRYLRLEGARTERLVGIANDPGMATLLAGRFTELRDVVHGRARRSLELEMVQRRDPVQFTSVVGAGGRSVDAEEVVLGPERLLLEALDDATLRSAGDTVIGGITHHIVAFGSPAIRLYVNAASHLPWGWRSVRAYPDDLTVWSMWGDVATLVRWGGWSLDPGGLRYPRLQRTWRNGIAYRTVAVTRLTVNPEVPADSVPSMLPGSRPRPPAVSSEGVSVVAPDVVFLPGQYNVVLVRQEAGVVVLGAPHSSEYSVLVLEEAERRFPGVPVNGVVVTSTAWPHVAGLREYVARGIAIHVAAPAAGLMRSLAGAPHTIQPDAQERAGARPRIVPVRDSATIGAGPNRIVLHRVAVPGGAKGSRSLLAWLPGRRFLFAGDLYVPERFEPNFFGQALAELTSAVARLGLGPANLVALHLPPTPWAAVLEEAAAAGVLSVRR